MLNEFNVVTFVYYSINKAPSVSTEIVEKKHTNAYIEWVKTAMETLKYNSYENPQEWLHNFLMIIKWEDEEWKPVSWIWMQAVVMVQPAEWLHVDAERKLVNE